MKKVTLVALDMAGTTVQDNQEVESCFAAAAAQTGLEASPARILAVQGMAKRFVFQMLWQEQLGPSYPHLEEKIEHSYQTFKAILEHHYQTAAVVPTAGCLDFIAYLKSKQIKIALTTGFYRQVTSIILHRLGWDIGLDKDFKGQGNALIDISVTSDEVPRGRPYPDMIYRAMQELKITDSQQVITIGDTPSDLEAGRNAGCLLSLGLTNGTHSRAQLEKYPNDGLFDSLAAVQAFMEAF